LSGLLLLSGSAVAVFGGEPTAKGTRSKLQAKVVKIGAVAYSPSAVTIFEAVCRYLNRSGLSADYVLFSNYDTLVEALHNHQIDIAWNTPLAHVQYHLKAGGASQPLVMRDVDCNVRSVLVARADADIRSLADLMGKTLILGSRQAAEATILPLHFLKAEGLRPCQFKVNSLDGKVDFRGDPCSSENHVLKALSAGDGQAGIISERLWNHVSKSQPEQAAGLKRVWISPPFSHCVFTAAADFDKSLGSQFTKLMLAMDSTDSSTADAMRLEGTRQWVAGSQDGFQELLKALREEPCCEADSSDSKR
jgi:ABC-type phosphate/phosphonate transport system substrate-binding protein